MNVNGQHLRGLQSPSHVQRIISTFVNNRVDLVIAHDELTTVNAENQRKISLDATLDESSTDPCCIDNNNSTPSTLKQEMKGERTRRSLSMIPLHNPCEYVPVYANRITITNGGDDFEIFSRNSNALGSKRLVKDTDAAPEKKEFIRNTNSGTTSSHHQNNRKFQRNAACNTTNRRSLYCDSTFDNNSSNEAIYNLYRPASYSHLVESTTATTTTPKQFSNNGSSNNYSNLVKLNQLGDKSTTVIIKSSDLNYRSIKLKKREKQLKLSSSLSSDSANDITILGGGLGQLHRARTEENISNIAVDDEPIINNCLKRSDMKSCEVLNRDETNEDANEKLNDYNRIRILVNEHSSSPIATATSTAGNTSNSTSYVEGKSLEI